MGAGGVLKNPKKHTTRKISVFISDNQEYSWSAALHCVGRDLHLNSDSIRKLRVRWRCNVRAQDWSRIPRDLLRSGRERVPM